MSRSLISKSWHRFETSAYYLFKTGMTALFLLMIFTAVLGIIARQISGIQFLWTGTVASVLLIFIIFLGAAIAEFEDDHIQIRFFSDRIVRRYPSYDYIIDIVALVFATTVAVSASNLTVRYWGTHWADLLWLPTGLLYLSIAVGFGLIALNRIRSLINALRGLQA
jgi:TRAP-type C4-dicarboxylate transport system permease small subunit